MPNCISCGAWIPEGQGSSCSMCYGDVDHGSDGYYRDWVERQDQEQENDNTPIPAAWDSGLPF